MEERLQKYLANSGVASRRKCEEYIQNGNVKVNGVEQTGIFTINEGDIVKLKFKGEDFEYVIKVVFKEAGYQFSSDTINVVLKAIADFDETTLVEVGNCRVAKKDFYTPMY